MREKRVREKDRERARESEREKREKRREITPDGNNVWSGALATLRGGSCHTSTKSRSVFARKLKEKVERDKLIEQEKKRREIKIKSELKEKEESRKRN